MECIVSRESLPDDISDELFYCLWSKKYWPYHEILRGDILYLYETKKKNITWKVEVVKVIRFPYHSKKHLVEKLHESFGKNEHDNPYLTGKPAEGYCIAWAIKPLEQVMKAKPAKARMDYLGWLKVTTDIANTWNLGFMNYEEHVTIDSFVAQDDSLKNRLEKLNLTMKDVSPRRILAIVNNTIRNDTPIVKQLKKYHDYRCQFPGCGVRIPMKDGGYYAEVAHIEPVREGGKSIMAISKNTRFKLQVRLLAEVKTIIMGAFIHRGEPS